MTNPAAPAFSDSLIAEAVGRLDMSARLDGPNRLLALDVRLPADAAQSGGDLLFVMRAAAEAHREMQAGEDMADIEETLEDAVKAGDGRGIDEGLDIYRALLTSRVKDIWRGPSGAERLAALEAAARFKPAGS